MANKISGGLNFNERLECLKTVLSKRYNLGDKLSDFTQTIFNFKSPSSYKQWEKIGKIPDKYLVILVRDYRVNGSWLNNGIGTMFIGNELSYSAVLSNINTDVDNGGSNYLLQIIKGNVNKLAEKDKIIVELRDEILKLKKD